MNNADRRVRKTQNALKEALAKLMAEKELHQITVRELTETADIHRATFYAHYQDVYDLYEQLKNSVMTDIDKMIDNDPTHTYESIYESVIEYVYENTALWTMLFGKYGNKDFQNSVCNLLEKKYLNIWLFEEHRTEISSEMRYLTKYHIQGCISMISLWCNSGFAYPKEKIIRLVRKVNENFDLISNYKTN